MKKIVIAASFGDVEKQVEIVKPSGAGGYYQILIDRYYQGTISTINGEWIAHLNNRSELTGDDVFIITESIEKNMHQ